MTNAEKIRSMTDEELAAFLAEHPVVSEFDASKSLHMDWLLWLSLDSDVPEKNVGKWIRHNVMSDEWYKLECSSCHKEFEIMDGDLDDYYLNYCPVCGSKNKFLEE